MENNYLKSISCLKDFQFHLVFGFTVILKWKNKSLGGVTYRLGPRSDENSQWKMRMLRFSGSSEVIGVLRNVCMMLSLV